MAARNRLTIDDGPTVRLDGEPAQGSRHKILFGALADGDARVVVKVERIPGALERERAVLAWLAAARPGVAPRPDRVWPGDPGGSAGHLSGERTRAGIAAETEAGWRRMGGAVASLAELGYPKDGVPVFDQDAFAKAHAERVTDLGSRAGPVRSLDRGLGEAQ